MAKKGKFLIDLEYAAAKGAMTLLGLLPRAGALFFAKLIMRSLPFVIPALKRTGMTNLEIAFPEKSVADRRAILRGTFDNLGRVLGELSQFHKYTRERLAELIDLDLDDETAALYERNKNDGIGVLLTTGHFGNWEMLVLGFAALYEPISYLARPLDNQKIDDMLNELRTRFGNTPINKSNSAMRAVSILGGGGGLGMLSDVNAHPKEGVFVPFFGVPACTPSGAAMIALRSNALIFPVACVWQEEKGRYKLVHGNMLEPRRTGDFKADVVAITAAYTAELEKIIRQYPEQWMWIHKRWKTRPPGEPPIY